MILELLRKELATYIQPEKATFLPRFFKTGYGQYGAGDQFLGVTVPNCRMVAKRYYKTIKLSDIHVLLLSPWHEERLLALILLVLQFAHSNEAQQKTLFTFYLRHTDRINNWDLVDTSAHKIVGDYIFHHPEQYKVLDSLAASKLLWERRIAVISTFYFLQHGDPDPTLDIVTKLLPDTHDLIQKANGWMLRELGKRIDDSILIDFLRKNYDAIPRTTLRYAIERFHPMVRARFLKGTFRD